jgi:sugar phosphate permease
MESTMTDRIESATMRKLFRRLIPLLFLMLFINYLDRINIGFAQLQMGDQLGISPSVFGFAGSIFFLGYMLLEVPSNLLLHRFGARRWIARILLSWGLVAALTAFVWDGTSLSVMRFLLGVMEAGFLPGVAVYVTKWFPERYRARAVSGYIIGSSVAAVVGGPVSTLIMTGADEFLGLEGWQWMFLLEGGAAVALGVVAFRSLTERPADARWLTVDEKTWLQTTLDAEQAALPSERGVRMWRIAADRRVWTLGILFGCALVGIYGLLLWLPQIVQSLGDLGVVQVGFLSAVPPLLGVAGVVLVGRSSDRTGDRKFHLAVVYTLSAAAIALSAFVPNTMVAYALLCLTGLFIYAGNPLFWSLAASFRTGAAGAATVALINTIAQFGGLVGPWSIGLVRESTGSFDIALLTIAVFLVVGAVLALTLRAGRLGAAPRDAVASDAAPVSPRGDQTLVPGTQHGRKHA